VATALMIAGGYAAYEDDGGSLRSAGRRCQEAEARAGGRGDIGEVDL